MYGRQTESAIAAMSRLAEVYDGGRTRLSASDIARERGLQGPFVAKILTSLSQAGLIDGTPGPGGGYALARPPGEITLHEVYALFERENQSVSCPFGGERCGQGEPCAIHHKLIRVQEALHDLLQGTTFEVFRTHANPGDMSRRPLDASPRRTTYRAPRSRAVG